MSKKILIVFGTRPEIIKLAPLIHLLKDSELKDSIIAVSTSQHEELQDEQLKFWNIRPDYFLTPCPFKGNLVRLLSHTLSGLQDIVDQMEPIDYIIVQGDTNTALACANLAFLNQIKLVHIEAGLRSFDHSSPFPEEFNRTIASKVAYFHFAPTQLSKTNLINEGIDPEKIRVIGNTGIDALQLIHKSQRSSFKEQNTVLITLHRRENIENNYLLLINIVIELSKKHPELNFIWITHPNCLQNIIDGIPFSNNITILEHLQYDKFIDLYNSAKMVITDSGGVTEEAIQLGLPVAVFRKKTERLEPIDSHYPMIVSVQKNDIIEFFAASLNKINTHTYSYGNGNASQEIMKWLKKEISSDQYDTIIVGGGPAGTGLLLKSLKDDKNSIINKQRIALIESSSQLIKGNITRYKVNSDTFSDVFLECLDGSTTETINISQLKTEIDHIKQFKGRSIPLYQLDEYYDKLGVLLKEGLSSDNKCDFYLESTVSKVIQKQDGSFEVFLTGKKNTLLTKQLVIATGGIPNTIDHNTTLFSGKISLEKHSAKLIHSDSVLKSGVPENIKKALKGNPQVVILGGSHSAFSTAYALLNDEDNYNFREGNIKIWCNKLPKIYFNTKEEAIEHKYNDFTDNDFCPVTKKLYRLAGLRMDGRDLYMKMLGLGNVELEKRVALNVFNDQTNELYKDLDDASLIILAFGYKLNMFPVLNHKLEKIEFLGEETGHWVNDNCEMLDNKGNIISNLYASGLATGFIPSGVLGGEPSFEGQTNGIWYYQNAIAERIISHLNQHPDKVRKITN